jgi:hypothetical protein
LFIQIGFAKQASAEFCIAIGAGVQGLGVFFSSAVRMLFGC